jgi:hypothetical protein
VGAEVMCGIIVLLHQCGPTILRIGSLQYTTSSSWIHNVWVSSKIGHFINKKKLLSVAIGPEPLQINIQVWYLAKLKWTWECSLQHISVLSIGQNTETSEVGNPGVPH